MPLDSMPTPEAPTLETAEKPTPPSLTGPGAKLAKLTVELCELIVRETKLLKDRLPREAQQLHGTKNRLMAEYRETLQLLQVNDKLLGPKDSKARKYIRQLTDNLREALRDHARIVLRLKSVAEGIVKSIGEEVIKKDRPVVSYGQNAAFKQPAVARPTSLQLNQVI